MKFTHFTLAAALLATVSAQGLDSLPSCSKSCANNAIPASCGLDIKCICADKSFLSNIACCVANKCSQADQETTLKIARGICASGGVTDLPTAISCSATSSGTMTATSTGTMTGTSSMTMTGSAMSSAASSMSSAASSASSVAASLSSAASSAASSASSVAALPTNAAVLGQTRDTSLIAAAGAAAAFAMLV
ncbi:Cell wall protein TIR3 [Penicillium diatomitis]|uniref:Cell wall protein TIR3 n=1 Tax=Penicillium diatomitis TaxID=2819901 RepID=A0A9X0BNR6_9EURO|nr:Cell wall protein TIR3 [Penicillium diatomitis]KAJ5477214.1 Cell wall protein TIR3 [Penicillium diatomitis]